MAYAERTEFTQHVLVFAVQPAFYCVEIAYFLTIADIGNQRSVAAGKLVQRCNDRGIHCYRIYGSMEHPTITAGIPGGENISSREVEECLSKLKQVSAVAAVAMPDKRLGEKVCCFVVLKPGHSLILEQVVSHFADSGMKIQKTPERVIVVDALPVNATGKVLKQQLRQQLKDEQAKF